MKGPLIYYEINHMYGANLSSTKRAGELYRSILDDINLGFNVEIDFAGVRSLSGNWAKNVFGHIIKKKGEEFFKNHILVTNTSKGIKKSIVDGIGKTIYEKNFSESFK